MTTSEKLQNELKKVLSGRTWYGNPVYTIIGEISFEAAFEKPNPGTHSIAEIVLHLIAWTEEVMDRMNGLAPGIPSSGDWPPSGNPDEQKWHNYVNDLKLVNVNLLGLIQNFPEEKWKETVSGEEDEDITYGELLNGLTQHHIYHSGQIALLKRIIYG